MAEFWNTHSHAVKLADLWRAHRRQLSVRNRSDSAFGSASPARAHSR